MTLSEAAKVLDLPAEATADQIEARFLELRARLEEKTARAPTPGLKEKYRAALATVTEAFETLTLAADATTLPVRHRSEPVARTAPVAAPVTPTVAEPAHTEVPQPSFGSVALMHFTGFVKFCIVQIVLTISVGLVWANLIEVKEAADVYLPLGVSLFVAFIASLLVWRRSVRHARHRVAEGKKNTLDNVLAIGIASLAAVIVAGLTFYTYSSDIQQTESRAEWMLGWIRDMRTETDPRFDAAIKAEGDAETSLSALRARERTLAANSGNNNENELRDTRALIRAQEKYVRWLGNILPGHPARRDRIKLDDVLTRLTADRTNSRLADDANKAFEAYRDSTNSLHWEIENRKPDPVFVTNIDRWREAAERDEAWAMWNLYLAFLDGKGAVEPDPDTAVVWLRRAAGKGELKAIGALASGLWYGLHKAGRAVLVSDKTEAIEWYRKGAEAGDTNCMMNLGANLRTGDNVAKDPIAAVEWLRKAAEGGDALAMHYLGECYANGEGITANEQAAIEWWTKAAKLDQYGAMEELKKRSLSW